MSGERELSRAYLERTRAELDDLVRRGVLTAGSAFPAVLLVKGAPGPAEFAGEALLAGADGAALAAALDRLGYAHDAWGAVSAFTLEGEGPDVRPRRLAPSDLALAVETFDPEAVVALDTPAARLLQEAWDLLEPLPVGTVARVRGRRVLSLGGFEAALAAEGGKAVMWARLRQLPPLGAPL